MVRMRRETPPLDLTPILVYRIANLPDSAVLAMVWQWDVLDPSWATGIAAGEAWDSSASIDLLTDIDTLSSQQMTLPVSVTSIPIAH